MNEEAPIEGGVVQRKCAACTEEDERSLQRKATGGPGVDGKEAGTLVNETLGASGRPLDEETLRRFEPVFGHSFRDVRVHDDERANTSARAIAAEAFTVGHHVAFRAGAFAPGTARGDRLLAHELTHVVQQSTGKGATGAAAQPSRGLSSPTDAAEMEADRVADAVTSARKAPPITAAAPTQGAVVHRQSAAEVAQWALGGAGVLFADDATGVGVLDDPIAIGLLGVAAVAGGIALIDALTSPTTTDVTDEDTTTTTTTDVTTDVEADRRRSDCFRQNPTALPCENADFGIEEIVVEFLLNEGFSWDDLGGCSGFSSFGAGTIDACDGAPGQSWHCNVAGSPDPVSVFGCLCCRPDGTTGYEWRSPHWSTYVGRRGRP